MNFYKVTNILKNCIFDSRRTPKYRKVCLQIENTRALSIDECIYAQTFGDFADWTHDISINIQWNVDRPSRINKKCIVCKYKCRLSNIEFILEISGSSRTIRDMCNIYELNDALRVLGLPTLTRQSLCAITYDIPCAHNIDLGEHDDIPTQCLEVLSNILEDCDHIYAPKFSKCGKVYYES